MLFKKWWVQNWPFQHVLGTCHMSWVGNCSPLIKTEKHFASRFVDILWHIFQNKIKPKTSIGAYFWTPTVRPFFKVATHLADRHSWHCLEALTQTRFGVETWHTDVENWRTDQQKIKLFGQSNNGKNRFWLNNVRDWESNKLYMVIAWIALHNSCTESYIMYQLSTCEVCLKK